MRRIPATTSPAFFHAANALYSPDSLQEVNGEYLQQHGILALVKNEIRQKCLPLYYKQIVASELKLKDFLAVLDLLEPTFLPYIPLKGISLSAMLYEDYSARDSADIDVAARPDNYRYLVNLFKANGYTHDSAHTRLVNGVGPVETFVCPQYQTLLELHFSVSCPERFGKFYDEFWRENPSFTLSTRSVMCLRPEVYLVYLMTHLARHIFSPRLIWIEDIRLLIKKLNPDWDVTVALMKRYKLMNACRIAAEFCNAVWEMHQLPAEIPWRVLSELEKLQTAHGSMISRYLLSRKSASAFAARLHCFGLSESWLDRATLIADFVRRRSGV